MRRPLIIFVVLTAFVAGLAPGASAAQRVRFDHRGDFTELGDTTVRYLGRYVEVTTDDLMGSQTIECTNRPCRQANIDGSDFILWQNARIYIEIKPSDFKGSDEELQAVVRGRSRTSLIFTDGFESGDLSAITGTATCQRTPAGIQVCDIQMEARGRVVPKGGGSAIGWSVANLSGTLRVTPSNARWTEMSETGTKAIDADRFGNAA